MMQIIEKNEGEKIPYEENGTKVIFGDDELMLNVARYQRDWPVHIDLCSNRDNQLVIGTGEGLYYVAELDIPAIKYEPHDDPGEEDDSEQGGALEPIPIDMGEVVLTLWSLETPEPVEI